MTPRLLAAGLGVLGGLLLVVAGGVDFLAGGSAGWRSAVAVVGYAVTVAALGAVGYGLVDHAPVWLRIIVLVAVPLLVASVWQLVDQAIDDRVDGWHGPATAQLSAGVIVLGVALLGLRRTAPEPHGRPGATHLH